MTESPYQLTVRVIMRPAVAAPAPVAGTYRWDRIAGAVLVATLLLVLAVWLPGTPQQEMEVAANPVATDTLVGAPQPDAGLSPPSVDSVELEPASKPAAQEEFEAMPPAEPEAAAAVEAETEVEAETGTKAEASEQVAAGESTAPATVRPVVAPEAAPEEAVAVTARPVASSTDSILRDPPVTAIATRIVSPRVKRFLITDAVVSREPVGDARDIREDRKVKGLVKVIAYSEVSGHAGDTLRYLWLRRDKVVANVPVQVGSDSWRSYTSKYLNKDMRGRWWVELQTSQGDLLAVTEFEF